MDLQLSGRVALVAGGSKGIGRGIALTLAMEGADVAICARNASELEEAAKGIQIESGRECLPVAADLSTEEGCRKFVQGAAGHFDRADILVYSANSPSDASSRFLEIPDEEWVAHINRKLLGAIRCSREVIPHMAKAGWGRIVLIGGMGARELRPTRMDNGPVCAGVANFGKQLSAQVIGQGIRVNTVHPGATATARRQAENERIAAEQGTSSAVLQDRMAASLPLGRLLEPGDIANLVAFLASDLADGITGQSIAVEGGATPGVHY